MSIQTIRLQVVSDSQLLPQWAHDMLNGMLALPGVTWHGWTVVPSSAAALGPMEKLYQSFDQHFLARGLSVDHPIQPTGAPPAMSAIWASYAGKTELPTAALEAWRSHAIDVVVWLLPQYPLLQTTLPAAMGLWILTLDGLPATDPNAGGAALLGAPHLCETNLLDFAPAVPELLYRSVSAAVTNSLAATRRRSLKKAQSFMTRRLAARLQHRSLTPPATADIANVPAPTQPVSAWALLSHVLGRVVKNRMERWRHLDQWQLAFTFNAETPWNQLAEFHFIEPPATVFWADPMPLYWQGKHWIMFEELPFAAPIGRLLAIEVQPDGSYSQPLPVMERPYHLSYPFMIRLENQLFMVPETSATRRVELHVCTSFPSGWQLDSVLLEDVNAVDATLYQHDDGRWWMWVSVVEEGAERGEELHLYYADQLRGPWLAHAANPVVSDIRCARPAGPIINTPDGLMRPAQNSAAAYGHHIEWRRITALTPEIYAEEPAGTLQPLDNTKWRRIHTVGAADGLRVLDVMVRRPRMD